MGKVRIFAVRNGKEILRDPLSYIFALGFPMIMLVIMTIVNASLPPEANMEIFQLSNLTPGIIMFGFTFVMLFTAILLAKDRCGAFLTRLYAAPVTSAQFLAGYVAPVVVLGLVQCAITYMAAEILALIGGEALLPLSGMLLSMIVSLPTLLLFIGLGLLFGGLFNDKAAPGISSVIITMATLLGGVWMDIETIGGVLYRVARVLPFFPATSLARASLHGVWDGVTYNLLVTCLWALASFALAALVFSRNRSRDLE